MDIFEIKNYKQIITNKIKTFPKRGHGQYSKMANYLGVHTTLLSQVINGPKDLTEEQALKVCEFFGFSKLQTHYFLALVRFERAGTSQLKSYIREEIEEVRSKSQDLASRIPHIKELSEYDRAIFYSNWYYCGIWLLTSIQGMGNVESLSSALKIPKKKISSALEFLVQCQLCVIEDGEYKMGPQRTHVPADSPLVSRHHINWRLKNMERFAEIEQPEIVYTSPVTISRNDAAAVRRKIVEFIEEFSQKVRESPSEEMWCFNLDWVKT